MSPSPEATLTTTALPGRELVATWRYALVAAALLVMLDSSRVASGRAWPLKLEVRGRVIRAPRTAAAERYVDSPPPCPEA